MPSLRISLLSRRFWLVGLAVLLSVQPGCVRRRMTIRTNPPGAVVYVDRQRIGVTPVSTDFTYYGTRTVELVKDGYETVTEQHKFTTPWYQLPGIDFFAENLWPFETRDERILDFQMVPQQAVPPSLVLNRAEQLRADAQQGLMTPMVEPKHGLLHHGGKHKLFGHGGGLFHKNTPAPPTGPPTMAPPVMGPPTMAPPTGPPTMAPPVMGPPTMAPPTGPPTMAPPTMAPPTMAPLTLGSPLPQGQF